MRPPGKPTSTDAAEVLHLHQQKYQPRFRGVSQDQVQLKYKSEDCLRNVRNSNETSMESGTAPAVRMLVSALGAHELEDNSSSVQPSTCSSELDLVLNEDPSENQCDPSEIRTPLRYRSDSIGDDSCDPISDMKKKLEKRMRSLHGSQLMYFMGLIHEAMEKCESIFLISQV